jgi:TBC1 domain family protein 5
MWDALFAIDSTLEIVDMISIAMLLRIRWDLVAADTNEAFSLLLRYPEPAVPAYTFIKDALYLRDHLTPQGGAEIISRYGKQAPAIELEASPTVRDPSPSPSFASSRTRRSLGSPRSFVGQQGAGLEAMLQGAAKNVFERGSQWGVGKAIREAVGEVKKNVEAYQSAASSGQITPRAGGREFRKPGQLGSSTSGSRPGLDRTVSGNAIRKIEGFEKRNRDLAKMLETAVGELWEHHRERTEEQDAKDDDSKGKGALEALSLAIAKVQFVQVYLEDSTIPLPEESTEQAASAKAAETLALPAPQSPVSERTPSGPAVTVEAPSKDISVVTSSSTASPIASPRPMSPSKSAQLQPSSNLSPRSRPHLTSSNFSWMLGVDSATSNFASGTAHSTFSSDEKRRMKGKGFLFGDDDEDEGSSRESKRGSVSGKGGAKGGKTAKGKHVPDMDVEEEIIDLDNMGKRSVL